MLKIFSKLTPNILNKGLRTSKVSIKEGFKLRPYDKSSALMVTLLLSSSKAAGATKKYGSKKDIVYFCYT